MSLRWGTHAGEWLTSHKGRGPVFRLRLIAKWPLCCDLRLCYFAACRGVPTSRIPAGYPRGQPCGQTLFACRRNTGPRPSLFQHGSHIKFPMIAYTNFAYRFLVSSPLLRSCGFSADTGARCGKYSAARAGRPVSPAGVQRPPAGLNPKKHSAKRHDVRTPQQAAKHLRKTLYHEVHFSGTPKPKQVSPPLCQT